MKIGSLFDKFKILGYTKGPLELMINFQLEDQQTLDRVGNRKMDATRLQQLSVINQMRLMAKPAEKYSMAEILDIVGISDSMFLEFGQIWREIGGSGNCSIFKIFFNFILKI